jgi:hypothetical protein
MNGQQVVDIAGKDMVLKLVAITRNAVSTRVFLRAIQEQVERGKSRLRRRVR